MKLAPTFELHRLLGIRMVEGLVGPVDKVVGAIGEAQEQVIDHVFIPVLEWSRLDGAYKKAKLGGPEFVPPPMCRALR